MSRDMKLEDLASIINSDRTSESVRAIWNSFVPKVVGRVSVWATEGTASPSDLARIYAVRLKLLLDTGREMGGFEEAIQALEKETDQIIGAVVETREYRALCFLSSKLDRMIGFLYYRK